jgi:hypothetical protein
MKDKDALAALHRIWPQLTPLQKKWLLVQAEIGYLVTSIQAFVSQATRKGASALCPTSRLQAPREPAPYPPRRKRTKRK